MSYGILQCPEQAQTPGKIGKQMKIKVLIFRAIAILEFVLFSFIFLCFVEKCFVGALCVGVFL